MKKIIVLLVALFGVMTLYSCYEDKGNYSYKERSDIEVEGLLSTYTRISLMDTLRIDPQPLGDEDYDYLWMMSGPGSFNFDTISHTRNLEWPVSKPQGEYRLVLKLTARSDSYSRWCESRLNIISTFSDGWFVLKDQEESTDIDFFPMNGGKMVNILEQSVGRSLAGEARCMGMMMGTSYIQHDGEIVWSENMIWAGSSKDLWMVRMADMSLQRDLSQLFFGEVPSEEPLNVPILSKSTMCLSTERNIFYQYLRGNTTGQMGAALDFGQGMKIAKSTCANAQATYFYDQQNQRFLAVNYNGTPVVFVEDGYGAVAPPVKVNQTGCSLLYMGINKYTSDNFYSVMENAEGRYVYTMLAPRGLWPIPPEGDMQVGTYNPIRAVKKLPADLKINEASLFAIASVEPYIYYNDAGGSTVHFYDILGGIEVNNVFPAISQAGERITFMKALFHNPNPNKPVPEDTFDKFVIATEKDGHYKVYLYDLLAGKPYPGREPIVLKGDGRVCSVQRIFQSLSTGYEDVRCSVNY